MNVVDFPPSPSLGWKLFFLPFSSSPPSEETSSRTPLSQEQPLYKDTVSSSRTKTPPPPPHSVTHHPPPKRHPSLLSPLLFTQIPVFGFTINPSEEAKEPPPLTNSAPFLFTPPPVTSLTPSPPDFLPTTPFLFWYRPRKFLASFYRPITPRRVQPLLRTLAALTCPPSIDIPLSHPPSCTSEDL